MIFRVVLRIEGTCDTETGLPTGPGYGTVISDQNRSRSAGGAREVAHMAMTAARDVVRPRPPAPPG